MTLQNIFRRPVSNGLFWGTVSAAATCILVYVTTSSLLQLIPVIPALVLSLLSLKLSVKGSTFPDLFVTGFMTFMVSCLLNTVYTFFVANPPDLYMPLGGCLWRLGMMICTAIVSSLIFSSLFSIRSRHAKG